MRLELIPWNGGPVNEDELRQRLEEEGFDPFRWHDPAGTTYEPHSHSHDESLWVIDGEITFHIGDKDYRLRPGDRLMLPAGTIHTAHVGNSGATYWIGQRLPHPKPARPH